MKSCLNCYQGLVPSAMNLITISKLKITRDPEFMSFVNHTTCVHSEGEGEGEGEDEGEGEGEGEGEDEGESESGRYVVISCIRWATDNEA